MIDLDEAKKLCAAATQGPWEYEDDRTMGGIRVRPPFGRPHHYDDAADAAFIAAARTLVPELIAEVERLRAEQMSRCKCDYCTGKKNPRDWCARCGVVKLRSDQNGFEDLDVCDACDAASRIEGES